MEVEVKITLITNSGKSSTYVLSNVFDSYDLKVKLDQVVDKSIFNDDTVSAFSIDTDSMKFTKKITDEEKDDAFYDFKDKIAYSFKRLTENVLEEYSVKTIDFDVDALEEIMFKRSNDIVKIGNTYEISRPLAIELLKEIRSQVLRQGGSVTEKFNLLHKTSNSAVVEFQIQVNTPDGSYTVSDIGEAVDGEGGIRNAHTRIAATRAIKRTLERLVGYDFINNVIMQIAERLEENNNEIEEVKEPATEKQVNLIKRLIEEGRINQNDVEFENLTKSQASKLLDKVIGSKLNPR